MANTPVSIRLDPETHKSLTEAALTDGRSVSGFAADLIRAGLSGFGQSMAADGESLLVTYVQARFDRLVIADVDALRECALALARVAVVGGAPTAGAVKELRSILAEVDCLLDGDDFGDLLSAPTMPIDYTP